MASLTISIKLPADRTRTGTLVIVDPITGVNLFGPVPVLGRAARNTATAHGNPNGDPLQPFGDTPTGGYRVVDIVANGAGTSRPVAQYGQSGSIVLDPASGAAATAKANGRTGLLIHAGRHAFSSVVDARALKPTNGCIRMLDWDMAELIKVVRNNGLLFPGTVKVEIAGPAGPLGDIDESTDDGDPPPLNGGVILP
jgi:hypothetical protein